MDRFVAAWRAGAAGGEFRATAYPDLERSPVPRFDLLKLRHYMHVGIQLSRGCPFSCEFCAVVELNGRTPRLKSSAQMIRQLDALHALGYRGHVDIVDDNLIGNRKAIKPLLAVLADWSRRRNYPFEFSTETSVDLAEDEELLRLMTRANFFAIFIGVETPDRDTLIGTVLHNPRAVRTAFSFAALYPHLRPFAAAMDAQIAARIEAVDANGVEAGQELPPATAMAASCGGRSGGPAG